MNVAEELFPMVVDGRVVELDRIASDLLKAPPIKLTIDGKEVEIARATLKNSVTGELKPKLTTILDAAQKAGVFILFFVIANIWNPLQYAGFALLILALAL